MNAELEALTKIAVAEKTKQFRKALDSHNISSESQKSIFATLNTYEDPISATFETFRSPFRIERYMEDNFNLVLPTRIQLGAGDFQYVPIIKLLKKITADKNFIKGRQSANAATRSNDILQDIHDGRHFKNSSFFQANPEALR